MDRHDGKLPGLLCCGAVALWSCGQSPPAARGRQVLDVFGALVTAGFFGLMSWQYVRFTAEAMHAGESSPILRWPIAPWWWAVTALIGVTTVVAIVVLAREIAGRDGADAPADPKL